MEVPLHKVELTQGFYLGKYPVTQAQFQAVMGSNPSKSTREPDCPVDNIGEDDALDFCGKFAEQAGGEVRLPTEAEWEYACRAGSNTTFFCGDDESELGNYAWTKENSNGRSHPVGQKKPNRWGLYDIHGNVVERVADKYERDYYAKSPLKDPTGPSPGTTSNVEYKIKVTAAGEYSLTALVVTNNYEQILNVSLEGGPGPIAVELPFTLGDWQEVELMKARLKTGENKLKIWRDKPPQYGIAIKEFTLKLQN